MTPKIESAAIVLAGNFNPAILQPSWLAARDLIRREEAEGAKVQVIAPQVTSFSLDWLNLQVLLEKFQAESTDSAHHDHLLALVVGIFTLLEHTPVSGMGINRRAHYETRSEDAWHALGDLLAPKDLWCEVIKNRRREGTPGLRTLVIEGNREGSGAEWIRIKVEPSSRVLHGVFVEAHEHYGVPEGVPDALAAFLDILQASWNGFLRDIPSIADTVLSWQDRS